LRFFRFRLTACLWGACAAAGFSALPASAQPAAPNAAAQPPLQGAAAALDHLHQAKLLTEMNPYLTGGSAAFLGFTLVIADSFISGMTTALSPKDNSPQAATEKALQSKVDALLKRYSVTDKAFKLSEKPDALPPALTARGHQFLSDALALSSDYEKAQPPKKDSALGSQFSGSDFPASSACTFHVLSATRVQIVPRTKPKSAFEARLEEGQWRIDLGGLLEYSTNSPSASKPKTTLITPQAAAFLKAIDDGDAAAVSRMLQAAPALANTPPAYLKAHSEEVSDFPLTTASLRSNTPIVTLLLKAGAKVNAENDFGETALDQAAQFGSKATLLLLLAHGANVAHRNAFGKTALHLAADSRDGANAVAILLAHGAAVNARDEEGKTPLGVALARSSQEADRAAVIKLLRQHGAKK